MSERSRTKLNRMISKAAVSGQSQSLLCGLIVETASRSSARHARTRESKPALRLGSRDTGLGVRVCVYTPFENLPPWIDAAILEAVKENRDEVLPDTGQDCAAWREKDK